MKPFAFDYVAPRSLDAALAQLAADEAARVIAGGQSLVPMLNLRLAPADRLVDLSRIAALRETVQGVQSITYGALTTHAAIEDGAVPDATNGLLRQVAAGIAFRAVRTRGTLGGSLALADPAADWVTTMVALDAQVHLRSAAGARSLLAGAFVLGAYYTALEPGEIIVAIEVPRSAPTQRWGWYKVSRKVGEYADSMALVLLDRAHARARVVLGAIGAEPLLLADSASALLAGEPPAHLSARIERELAASGRGFDPVQLRRHRACVLRALNGVLQ
jgi:aerobic carbon-monoxide dehydrogenase medium subunit